jgi:hypothetical protein
MRREGFKLDMRMEWGRRMHTGEVSKGRMQKSEYGKMEKGMHRRIPL